ncbi:hypothetical protein VKT23_009326 [Stygiomarasmius scandens]|uniref:Uncharacterized protein n=1 Tax=Marasmiellus scandens TaxID=2682957 RepID=A0ABR1JKB5_9AGAR
MAKSNINSTKAQPAKTKTTTQDIGKKKNNNGSDQEAATDSKNAPPHPKWSKKTDVKACLTPKEKDTAWRSHYDKSLMDEQLLGMFLIRSSKSPIPMHLHDPKYAITHARYDTATSNLKAHVIACNGKVAPPEQAIMSFMGGGHYDKGLFCLWLDLWIARSADAVKHL